MSMPMTASDARTFTRFSTYNASAVCSALKCGCEPYADVFTYRRWQAQGYQVLRGEKAVKIPVVRRVEHETDNGEIETRRVFAGAAVFCRCQVSEVSADDRVYRALPKRDEAPMHIDTLAETLGMSASAVCSALLTLEVANKARQHPGKQFTR